MDASKSNPKTLSLFDSGQWGFTDVWHMICAYKCNDFNSKTLFNFLNKWYMLPAGGKTTADEEEEKEVVKEN